MKKPKFDLGTDIDVTEAGNTTAALTGQKKIKGTAQAKVNFWTNIEDVTKLQLIATLKHCSQKDILAKLLHDYVVENEKELNSKTVSQLAADIAAARAAENE
mgnify:CR=1 FL=1